MREKEKKKRNFNQTGVKELPCLQPNAVARVVQKGLETLTIVFCPQGPTVGRLRWV